MGTRNNGDSSHPGKEEDKIADIATRLFRAPKPHKLVAPMLALSIIYALILIKDLSRLYETVVTYGFLIIFVPTLLSGLVTKPICDATGGKSYFRRTMLLSFLSLLLLGLIIILGSLLSLLVEVAPSDILLFAFSGIIWLRHIVLVATSDSRHLRTLLASSSQTLLGFLMLHAFVAPWGIRELTLAGSLTFLFVAGTILLTFVLLSPINKSFKVDGLSLVGGLLAHLTEGGNSGRKTMEDFYCTFAEPANVDVGLIAFRRPKELRPKLTMFLPCAHPGPFGTLAGSDLPRKTADALKGRAGHLFMPHSASTHDCNPATTRESLKLAAWVKDTLPKVAYCESGTAMVRKAAAVHSTAQRFGDTLFLTYTASPGPSDDVEPEVGRDITRLVKERTGLSAQFADAHNCVKRGSGYVKHGSSQARDLLEVAVLAAVDASRQEVSPLRLGYAESGPFDHQTDGIGPCGIQVAVIEANNQKTAYLLYDGNNMVQGLREKLLESVSSRVDDAEVLTTDNHIVNAAIGGFNPVGLKFDWETLARRTVCLVESAILDLERVETGAACGHVRNLLVFGKGNTKRIATAVNRTSSRFTRISVPSLLITYLLSALFFILASQLVF